MMPSEPPNAALIAALAAGQAPAYAELYERLGEAMVRAARSMLGPTAGAMAEAEDAVQDVFVSLVRSRQRLAGVVDLKAYVFATLRNNVGQRLKRNSGEGRALRRLALVLPDASEDPPAADGDLETLLASLPIEQREVVVLKIDGGLTFAQIAEVVGISPNTAASRYRYAMEKLRRGLEEQR